MYLCCNCMTKRIIAFTFYMFFLYHVIDKNLSSSLTPNRVWIPTAPSLPPSHWIELFLACWAQCANAKSTHPANGDILFSFSFSFLRARLVQPSTLAGICWHPDNVTNNWVHNSLVVLWRKKSTCNEKCHILLQINTHVNSSNHKCAGHTSIHIHSLYSPSTVHKLTNQLHGTVRVKVPRLSGLVSPILTLSLLVHRSSHFSTTNCLRLSICLQVRSSSGASQRPAQWSCPQQQFAARHCHSPMARHRLKQLKVQKKSNKTVT